jgi:hypothetical protein
MEKIEFVFDLTKETVKEDSQKNMLFYAGKQLQEEWAIKEKIKSRAEII